MIINLMIETLNLYFKSMSVFVPVKFILTELLILKDELFFVKFQRDTESKEQSPLNLTIFEPLNLESLNIESSNL